ncbi:hypothetical protein PR048_023732, partial [Dryococelus australis]
MSPSDFLDFMTKPDSISSIIQEYNNIVPAVEKEAISQPCQIMEKEHKINCCLQVLGILGCGLKRNRHETILHASNEQRWNQIRDFEFKTEKLRIKIEEVNPDCHYTSSRLSIMDETGHNRYPDTPCWDSTRVVLSSEKASMFDQKKENRLQIIVTAEDSTSTYIHANYVDGYNDVNKSICTQGPKKNTSVDFWQMVWEQESRIILSLTETDDDDKICYEYWVNSEDYEIIFGRFSVKTLEILEESLLSEVHKKRKEIIKEAENSCQPPPGPIVVHCSVGADRSGAFCTIDNALSQVRKELPQIVLKIRSQRHSGVLDSKQY